MVCSRTWVVTWTTFWREDNSCLRRSSFGFWDLRHFWEMLLVKSLLLLIINSKSWMHLWYLPNTISAQQTLCNLTVEKNPTWALTWLLDDEFRGIVLGVYQSPESPQFRLQVTVACLDCKQFTGWNWTKLGNENISLEYVNKKLFQTVKAETNED